MSNKQYDIEFDSEVDISKYYVDQAMSGGVVFSAYTPYGISCIDAQFGSLIRNVNVKVKQLYEINRRKDTFIAKYGPSAGKTVESLNYKTFYDPIELGDIYSEVRVEWENGDIHDFYYGDKPVFDIITRKSDPGQLRKSIKENPHLHVMIKENLLENLDSYLKNKTFSD